MKPIVVTDQDFEEKIIRSSIPVLVDFWAPWCEPCKIVSPIVEELAEEYRGRVGFATVNVDENPEKAGTFGVQSIPNLKLFKNGNIVDEIIGVTPRDQIKSAIDKQIR